MTHPSIQGLREAVRDALDKCWCGSMPTGVSTRGCPVHGNAVGKTEAVTNVIAAYLTEHGVGWFGEGLVRAERSAAAETDDGHILRVWPCPDNATRLFRIVSVPQGDG